VTLMILLQATDTVTMTIICFQSNMIEYPQLHKKATGSAVFENIPSSDKKDIIKRIPTP